LPRNLTYEQFEAFAKLLAHVDGALAWWWGDLLLHGEGAFGERFASAQALANRDPSTILSWITVARIFRDVARRRAKLEWAHHREVCRLRLEGNRKGDPDVKTQDEWLDRAEKGDGNGERWSVARLREEIAKAHGRRPRDFDEELDHHVAAVRAFADRCS